MGVHSLKKEFAPPGANSFLKEWTPLEGLSHPGPSKQEVPKLLPFEQNVGKHSGVSLQLKYWREVPHKSKVAKD